MYKIHDVEDTGYRTQDIVYRMAGCRIRDAGYRQQDTHESYRIPGYRVLFMWQGPPPPRLRNVNVNSSLWRH